MDSELLRYTKTTLKLTAVLLVLLIIYLLYAHIGGIFLRILKAIPGYIAPFVIALLLAMMVEPLIGFMEKRLKLGRRLAAFISMIIVLGSLTLVISLLISRLINELIELYGLLNGHSSELSLMFSQWALRVQDLYRGLHLPATVEQSARANLGGMLDILTNITMTAFEGLKSFVAGLPEFFILFIVTTVATYFMAAERSKIWEGIMRPLPEHWEDKSRDLMTRIMAAFLGFLRAIGILISITAIQTIIGLLILDVPYAFTLGLVIGICDIIPLVGPGIVYIPWVIWEFANGHTGLAIGLIVVWVTGIIIRQLLEPKIYGDQLGLHPLATLASLYIGMKAFGGIGIILGPVTVILVLACIRAGMFDFMKKRNHPEELESADKVQ
ncbi:MAG: sporulation integral membrane protein YtvI [Acidobacteriota bacterium]